MYIELTQNEVTKIPRDRAEFIDALDNVVPATTVQYIWFPIKRNKDTTQIIWVEDTADLIGLTYEDCIDDYQSILNTQCLQYLISTDYKIIKSQEILDYIVDDKVLIKRALCRVNIQN